MRDRRQRTGYRVGAMSDGVRQALAAEVTRLEELDDPIEKVRAVGNFFAALDIELETVAAVRLGAIAELRGRSMTYQQIVDATGLSYPRVAQLARDARAGGRAARPPSSAE